MPRFALCAAAAPDANSLMAAYPILIESKLRPPLEADTFALVRPDGYLACSTKQVGDLAAYLDKLMPTEPVVS